MSGVAVTDVGPSGLRVGLVAVAESKGVVPEEEFPRENMIQQWYEDWVGGVIQASVPAGQTFRECPFCGGSSVLIREGSSFRWRVAECAECGATCGEARRQTSGEGSNESWDRKAEVDAAAEWNKRHYDAEMASLRAENARLRSALQEPMRAGECICVRCSLRQGRIGGVQGDF